jgi:hypothetical protein
VQEFVVVGFSIVAVEQVVGFAVLVVKFSVLDLQLMNLH